MESLLSGSSDHLTAENVAMPLLCAMKISASALQGRITGTACAFFGNLWIGGNCRSAISFPFRAYDGRACCFWVLGSTICSAQSLIADEMRRAFHLFITSRGLFGALAGLGGYAIYEYMPSSHSTPRRHISAVMGLAFSSAVWDSACSSTWQVDVRERQSRRSSRFIAAYGDSTRDLLHLLQGRRGCITADCSAKSALPLRTRIHQTDIAFSACRQHACQPSMTRGEGNVGLGGIGAQGKADFALQSAVMQPRSSLQKMKEIRVESPISCNKTRATTDCLSLTSTCRWTSRRCPDSRREKPAPSALIGLAEGM